jgi:hypothetical protein
MLREFILPPDAEKRLQVEGKYLTITQATGPIEIQIGGTLPITVDEKDRIHLRDDSPNNRAIRIKNVSGGTNYLELHTSDLLVDKRTAIDVNNSISVAADQLIGIDPTANIVQSIIQNAVQIDPTANAVDATIQNPIQIDPTANAVDATIQNPVQIDPTANAVDATIQNPVQVRDNTNIFSYKPTITFAASSPPIEIVGHSKRNQLILTADAANTGIVWIGGVANQGVPLSAGERIMFQFIAPLDVVGDLNDTLYIGETQFPNGFP